MSNNEYLRQFCNAVSEWRYCDEVQEISKTNLLFELGNLAFLCVEEEMTSGEVMNLWNKNGCFAIGD